MFILYTGAHSGTNCGDKKKGHLDVLDPVMAMFLFDKCHLTLNILAFVNYDPFLGTRNSWVESDRLLGGKYFLLQIWF